MPLADLQAKTAARRAARALKSYVNNNTASTLALPQGDLNNNAASTSALPWDDNDEINYGIPEFDAAGLQELDVILDGLANGT